MIISFSSFWHKLNIIILFILFTSFFTIHLLLCSALYSYLSLSLSLSLTLSFCFPLPLSLTSSSHSHFLGWDSFLLSPSPYWPLLYARPFINLVHSLSLFHILTNSVNSHSLLCTTNYNHSHSIIHTVTLILPHTYLFIFLSLTLPHTHFLAPHTILITLNSSHLSIHTYYSYFRLFLSKSLLLFGQAL